MSLSTAYLITPRNLDSVFNSIISAQAPERFSTKFLESLGFSSSNDRLYIGVLKSLGFIDANSVPTEKYYQFLDQGESKKILADAIKNAYSDLFALQIKANEMTQSEIENKFKVLTQGKKSETVLHNMAITFKALCNYADWEEIKTKNITKSEFIKVDKTKEHISDVSDVVMREGHKTTGNPQLHYNIQIHLPETRDVAVYDAIFRSLRDHLL